MVSQRSWSRHEVELIVDDYFEMLKLENEGLEYSKTAHRKSLRPLLNERSNGSVEFKHCNISAVLRDAKRPYVDGYKPRGNAQGLLRRAVEEKWIEWARQPGGVQIGRTIDIDSLDPFRSDSQIPADPLERYLRPIRLRRGASMFRRALLELYDEKCAITGDGPAEVLEAAHIEPHSERGQNSLKNGLLLRADIHTLFDLGLLTIDPETYEIHAHQRLVDTKYVKLQGVRVRPRVDGSMPGQEYLADRWNVTNLR